MDLGIAGHAPTLLYISGEPNRRLIKALLKYWPVLPDSPRTPAIVEAGEVQGSVTLAAWRGLADVRRCYPSADMMATKAKISFAKCFCPAGFMLRWTQVDYANVSEVANAMG